MFVEVKPKKKISRDHRKNGGRKDTRKLRESSMEESGAGEMMEH